MYGLDINFLKDRAAYNPSGGGRGNRASRPPAEPGSMTPLFIGVGVGLFSLALVGTGWWILQAQNSQLDESIALLEQENQKLEAEIGNINKIRQEISRVKGETQALVTVFDQIRPWSAMLQDVRDRIPTSVQLSNIEQTPPAAAEEGKPSPNPAGGVKISGYARTFNDVNDFLLTLQQSRFLKAGDTRITSAELGDAPMPPNLDISNNAQIRLPKVVKYTIESSLSEVPASELMRELEQKGTVGLVSRIRNLQQTGALKR